MNYGQIILADCANGDGIRLSLFVSGCRHHCKGCFQPQTWNFNFGKEFTSETKEYIMTELSKNYYDGITILGGEPFEPENQIIIHDLITSIKSQLPNKTIWIYTGFLYEDLLDSKKRCYTPYINKILQNVDVLVDGPFIENLKNISLKFKGSENQRILDLNKMRNEKLYDDI